MSTTWSVLSCRRSQELWVGAVGGGDPGVPLESGGELVFAFESEIVAPLVGEAVVVGVPLASDGTPIADLDPVTDANDAGVFPTASGQIPGPAFVLEKTVLSGHDARCAGLEATDEVVTGEAGDAATFCFRVVNTGTTYLFPITVIDSAFGITDSDMQVVSGDPTQPLAPGASMVFAYNYTLTRSLVNDATATAVPSGPDGSTLTIPALTSVNDARVAISEEALPATGSVVTNQIALGLALLAAGSLLVSFDRRKRTSR